MMVLAPVEEGPGPVWDAGPLIELAIELIKEEP
jgi:hypothetical protein